MIYQDKDGIQIQAYMLNGPTILNTIHGEIAGEEGQYVVTLPDNKIVLMTAVEFEASFSLIG